jgi:hypothetical protein
MANRLSVVIWWTGAPKKLAAQNETRKVLSKSSL